MKLSNEQLELHNEFLEKRNKELEEKVIELLVDASLFRRFLRFIKKISRL